MGTGYLIATLLFGGFHVWMLFKNITSLEVFAVGVRTILRSGSFEPIFDVGWKQNFYQTFGTNPFLWPLPIFTAQGDGCSFPIHRKYQ